MRVNAFYVNLIESFNTQRMRVFFQMFFVHKENAVSTR
jgi:hypothetical protein